MQICIWPSWCHCYSLSLASLKFRLVWVPADPSNPRQSPECCKVDVHVVDGISMPDATHVFSVVISLTDAIFVKRLWVLLFWDRQKEVYSEYWLLSGSLYTFLANHTICRAFGTLCRLSSVCCLWLLYCGKTVRFSEKLSEGVNRKPGSKSWFFVSPPYFYFRFRCYGHQGGRFCLIFARTAQQSMLDGTNWLSSSKPCAYYRIV